MNTIIRFLRYVPKTTSIANQAEYKWKPQPLSIMHIGDIFSSKLIFGRPRSQFYLAYICLDYYDNYIR